MTTSSHTLLKNRVASITGRNYAIPLGRAALGLKLLLDAWWIEGRCQKIALPSFLCQSPLAAVLAANWEPVFCDVDLVTANVSESEWERVLALGVDAVLFVHLFGNACSTQKISDKCKEKGIRFIEDVAQAFGGVVEGNPCGCHGDAALVSFGHTKLIDVQMGGMLLLDDVVLYRDLTRRASLLPQEPRNRKGIAKRFTKAFYKARHGLISDYRVARKEFSRLMSIYVDLLDASWDETKIGLIHEGLDVLGERVSNRREKAMRYLDLLEKTALVPIELNDGSVPWRAIFRLDGISWREQYAISEEVRGHHIDVSNWYVPSHWMIGNGVNKPIRLKSTEKLSQEIFQFWLDEKTPLSRVNETVSVVTTVLQDAGYA